MAFKKYQKAVIWGVGMMGGSLALVLKKKKIANEVWGLGRNLKRLKTAKQKLKLDGVGINVEALCADADLIILAGPFGKFEEQLKKLSDLNIRPTLLTELASLKGGFVKKWTLAAGKLPFVASHPMCGSEKSGFVSAREKLFEGATCILTPVKKTKSSAQVKAKALWESLGMTVIKMTPEEHDRKIGALSHLTHAAAFALAESVSARVNTRDYRLAGTGYWDTTRISAADPQLWVEILRGNPKEMDQGLEILQKKIAAMRKLIKAKSAYGLKKHLTQVSSIQKKAVKKNCGK